MVTPRTSYLARRAWIEEYFDRTAAETWARLTSEAPVGRIRSTVREGRDKMRALLASWLPDNLTGCRVLDAGCGTGALAADLAARGARVLGVDLSPNLVQVAADRMPAPLRRLVAFEAGDMLAERSERFDYVVAMDSLIHYDAADLIDALGKLARQAKNSVLFTFAPRTTLLATMHAVGSLLPRGNRAPRIVPIAEPALRAGVGSDAMLEHWRPARTERIRNGFYTSQAMELCRPTGTIKRSAS
jgi:magnesium-protoporphyrin O-methyltransferase